MPLVVGTVADLVLYTPGTPMTEPRLRRPGTTAARVARAGLLVFVAAGVAALFVRSPEALVLSGLGGLAAVGLVVDVVVKTAVAKPFHARRRSLGMARQKGNTDV